jgi:hypothetical protein
MAIFFPASPAIAPNAVLGKDSTSSVSLIPVYCPWVNSFGSFGYQSFVGEPVCDTSAQNAAKCNIFNDDIFSFRSKWRELGLAGCDKDSFE